MADRKWSEYCTHYYNLKHCPFRGRCLYQHKTREEVEQVVYNIGEDFFIGRPRVNRVCRYFLRGNCVHQLNCKFRHDIQHAESNFLRHGPDAVSQSARAITSSGNLPSTSQSTDVTNKNSINIQDRYPVGFMIGTSEINTCETFTEKENNEIKPQDKNKETKPEAECTSTSSSLNKVKESWVNAPEFVPKNFNVRPRSYAEALSPEALVEKNANLRLCPHANKDGICRNMTDCNYLHGELCDMCERLVLHPFNEEQKKRHRQECLKQHEKNMELSFAIARSREKSCGVCFEVIMEKANGEQRFGILPNCNHCFCLTCIRKWRQARQFENKIIRACPECRVTSDFVCPSTYWVDTKEDKDKLIDDYKQALAKKDCKYFKKGTGKCPFGNKCFYLHAYPDGQKCDVGPPQRQRRPRNAEIDVLQVMLWDFLDEREFPWQSLAELEDLVSIFTDSDESDWSDYELFMD